MKTNINPHQLELPFTKNNYKNNLNSIAVSELEINLSQSAESDFDSGFDPHIPSQSWDKRSKKKFYAVIWANRYEEKIIKVYATSERVARKYLNDNFLLNELYYSHDFPTEQLNQEISNEFKFQKFSEEDFLNG